MLSTEVCADAVAWHEAEVCGKGAETPPVIVFGTIEARGSFWPCFIPGPRL